MTDKTDIAVLMRDMRDLADRIVECQGENSDGEEIIHLYDQSDTTFKAQNILLVLNAFEAERQRADNANDGWLKVIAERDAAEQKSRNYEQVVHGLAEEIAALKGDQVPVALVDERQRGGGFCLTQHGRRLNLPHGTELFTAPQKPVVLPTAKSTWHRAGYPEDSAYERGYNAGLADSAEAIEAAGGIVKDGE